MKRLLYLGAFVCLVGVLVCVYQSMTMPNLIGQAIEAVDNKDASAREEVEDAREQIPEIEGHLKQAGLFGAGFAACVFLARRVSPPL